MTIGACMLAGLLMAPIPAPAQLPGGMQMPGGALPMGGLSKDALLSQAKQMVTDLTAMKSSGKLAAEQVTQVDTLLPKATSLTTELAKPQIEATKLPQLATEVKDLQTQVGALKGLMK
jgi:outer membrane murein-binding lipoprotein Lpp